MRVCLMLLVACGAANTTETTPDPEPEPRLEPEPEPLACPETFVEAVLLEGHGEPYRTGAPLPETHARDAAHAAAVQSQIPTCRYSEGGCGLRNRLTGCDSWVAEFHCVASADLAEECPEEPPQAEASCEGAVVCRYPSRTMHCQGGTFVQPPEVQSSCRRM